MRVQFPSQPAGVTLWEWEQTSGPEKMGLRVDAFLVVQTMFVHAAADWYQLICQTGVICFHTL